MITNRPAGKRGRPRTVGQTQLNVRLSYTRKNEYRAAAGAIGLSAWVIAQLDRAAGIQQRADGRLEYLDPARGGLLPLP